MSTGVPLASGKSEIFEIVLQFMPDWVQIPVLVLVILLVVGSWVYNLKRKIDRRRAVRRAQALGAVQAAPQHGQGRGADYLGPYAPQQQAQPQSAQPSGADFLGAYAPQQQARPQPAQPSGADFLGAYAPQQPQGNSPA